MEKYGTLLITKRISGAGNTIYTCHVVVAKGRPYNCELLPDLSRTTIPSNLVWRYWNSHERHINKQMVTTISHFTPMSSPQTVSISSRQSHCV